MRSSTLYIPFHFAVLIAAACFTPTEVCGCQVSTYAATVRGQVTRAGSPVPGAEVFLAPDSADCRSSFVDDGRRLNVISGPDGRYQLSLRLAFSSVCLRLAAIDGPDTVRRTLPTVTVRALFGRAEPDIVPADFSLP
jgi:hypothetical protein